MSELCPKGPLLSKDNPAYKILRDALDEYRHAAEDAFMDADITLPHSGTLHRHIHLEQAYHEILRVLAMLFGPMPPMDLLDPQDAVLRAVLRVFETAFLPDALRSAVVADLLGRLAGTPGTVP